MERKRYVVLTVLLCVCMLVVAIVIGIRGKNDAKGVNPKDDIEQLKMDNQEEVMEDEIFEGSEEQTVQEQTTIQGSEAGESVKEEKSQDDKEQQKNVSDTLELPRIPLD